MSEEDDAQAHSVEAARVGAVYRELGSDPRRRRAWAGDNPGNRAIRAELEAAVWELVAAPAEHGVLDIGCGTGWWLAAAADRSGRPADLAGIEIQRERAGAARQRVPGADIRLGDARALPWPNGRFGAAVLLTTLSSLADEGAVRAALVEARRVVRDDGTVVVWDLRLPSPRARRRTVPRALVRASLEPVRADRSITLLPPLARRLAPAYPLLSRFPGLRSHYLVAGPGGDRTDGVG